MNAVQVQRFDRLAVLPALAAPTDGPSGGLRGEMVIATVGELVYTHADDPSIPVGEQRINVVDETTLSDPEWLQSLKGATITMEHPAAAVGLNDVPRVRIGTILNARYSEGATIAEYVIDTPEGMDAIKSGIRGVSPGYKTTLVAYSGDKKYPEGTMVQRDRRANHTAVTIAPRGAQARLRADGSMSPMAESDAPNTPAEEGKTESMDAVGALGAKFDAMCKKMDAFMEFMKGQKSKSDSVPDADTKVDEDPEALAAAVHKYAVDWAAHVVRANALGVKVEEADRLDSLRDKVVDAAIKAADDIATKRDSRLDSIREGAAAKGNPANSFEFFKGLTAKREG